MRERKTQAGEPAPVVLVHGLFMTKSFWHPENYAALSRVHEVHTISLPGHYPEAPFSGELSGETILDCFDRQLDEQVGRQPVFLVGHSTGGLMALFYAACRPERVRAVVSVGGSETGEEEALSYRFLQHAAIQWGLLGEWLLAPTLWLNRFSERTHRLFLHDTMADAEAVLARDDVQKSIEAYLADLHNLDTASMASILAALRQFDASDQLKLMKVPAMIICGDQDCFVSRDRTYRLGDLIPGAEVHIFEDCGHMCMWEHPDSFYNLLIDYFERHAKASVRRSGSAAASAV